MLAMSLRMQYSFIPSTILSAQSGSMKFAVPVAIAEAPAMMNSMASEAVIIPPSPGVFSARGILTMNLVHRYARAYARSMDRLDIQELEAVYKDMENSALEILSAEGMSKDEIEFARSLDMCYESQLYSIETPVPDGKLMENSKIEIGNAFESLHETKYGHRIAAPLATAFRIRAAYC